MQNPGTALAKGSLSGRGLLGMSGYHWLVIAAGWAGWGFDVFDALLFNFVAPNCIPVLLHLPRGSVVAREATVFWTGAITSILLVGWAAGGVLFGWIGDRIGRKRALFATIALYAVGTAACAAATNIWELVLFRIVASLGIGGEFGLGATLIAETVPEKRRVEAGVIMYTSSPVGLALASLVNYEIAGVWFAAAPQSSWRYVFLAGLVPVALALLVRVFIRESEQWKAPAGAAVATPLELFQPGVWRLTLSGFIPSVTALLTWWACNAFIPLLGGTLANEHAAVAGLSSDAASALSEAWKARASNLFNFGGLLGSLAAIPLARTLGRRGMFIVYFVFSALALLATFGPDLSAGTRLALLLPVGAGIYGVFAGFSFYLPELFPARLRATGTGFCYNIGRVFAAAGPFVVGSVSAAAGGSSGVIIHTLLWLALVPLAAAVLTPFLVIETREHSLPA
jgi:MFS family permease